MLFHAIIFVTITKKKKWNWDTNCDLNCFTFNSWYVIKCDYGDLLNYHNQTHLKKVLNLCHHLLPILNRKKKNNKTLVKIRKTCISACHLPCQLYLLHKIVYLQLQRAKKPFWFFKDLMNMREVTNYIWNIKVQ